MKGLSRRLALALAALLQRDRHGKVLFYHDIYSSRRYTDMGTPLSRFMGQMRAAERAGFKLVSQAPEGMNEIQICLDDGFRGIYDSAEWFEAKGIYPTIFIAPELVGRAGFLTWAEIRALKSRGFSFQSHTWSHRSLTEISDSELNHELNDSMVFISDKLGCPVTDVCFPRGRFSDHVVAAALQAGYVNLFTSVPGAYCDILPLTCSGVEALKTRNLVQFLSPRETVSVLKGGLRLFQRRYLDMQYVHG